MGKEISKRVVWRRSRVAELDSKGYSQPEIASVLRVSLGTINADLKSLRLEAKENFRNHIEDRLPHEYERCLVGLNLILKEAWTLYNETKSTKERLHALSLAKECCEKKLDLLTNATAIRDAIKLVLNHHANTIPALPPSCGVNSAETDNHQYPHDDADGGSSI